MQVGTHTISINSRPAQTNKRVACPQVVSARQYCLLRPNKAACGAAAHSCLQPCQHSGNARAVHDW